VSTNIRFAYTFSFFEDYKKLEKKIVTVEGYEGPEVAKKIVAEGMESYNNYMKEQESKLPNTWTPGYQKFRKFYRSK
jgi:uncharacterized short protein YbdD (DUF466 family)